MDRKNPHNSYYYKPMDQAAPIYVPPSHSTQRVLPVPQEAGQGDYHYGRPGEARPNYIPSSADSKKANNMPNVALSDRHSKEQIQRLSAKNDALTAALDGAHASAPEGNLPPTEYPRLPSHTSFAAPPPQAAPSPVAAHVAAQNAQMMGQPPAAPPMSPQAPPQGMQPPPQQQNFARSQNPAFNVQGGMPDMSALDEAYRRMGNPQS